jgi:hypothetical protein
MRHVVCLLELGKLVLENVVKSASLSSTWNRKAHLSDVANDEVEMSSKEQIDP